MISTIFVVSKRGQVLICRAYKDDVSRAEISNFCQRVVATKELKDAPMRRIDDCHYIHVNDAHVAIVAATKRNATESARAHSC